MMPGSNSPRLVNTGLACLLHPASLLALLILGLNDHLWKGVGPAWLTGKLSDFAGVFYFPFLVLVLIGLLVPAREPSSARRIARSVFWGVGIWFAAAKCISVVHAATVALAEAFLGPIEIVMDPGDAMAVVVLLPAWMLFRRVAAAPPKRIARAAKPAVLGVTILLTAATSRPWAASVEQLIVHEGQLYATVGDYYDASRDDMPTAFRTTDGMTWTESELAEEVVRAHVAQRSVIWQGERLEARGGAVLSAEGTHSFAISEARQEFMRASGAMKWSVSDMALLPESPEVLVVALETQGVVVLNKEGAWKRYAVGDAIPTPSRMSASADLGRAAMRHGLFGVCASLMCWVLLSLLIWRGRREGELPLARQEQAHVGAAKRLRLFMQNAKESYGRALRGSGYLVRGILCLLPPALIFFGHLSPAAIYSGPVPVTALLSVPFLFLGGILIAIAWNDFNERYKRKPKKTYFLSTLPIGALSSGTFVLWDLGILESATSAICLSAFVILAKLTFVAGRLNPGNS